jgi:osmotically-inducible protein OsmY
MLLLLPIKNLSAWDINVDTRLGVATSRGHVNSKEVIKETIRTAKNVDGVKEVKSLLVVDKGR